MAIETVVETINDSHNLTNGNQQIQELRFKKRALITGITGQVGSYLAELLLDKNYEVHGMIRRKSSASCTRIGHLSKYQSKSDTCVHFQIHYGDLTDKFSLIELIRKIKPDEIYNLAAQSHVGISFQLPELTCNTNGLGALHILDAIKIYREETKVGVKYYQASTSELFGGSFNQTHQNEKTPFYPRSPYACSKLMAHSLVINYREAYKMFAVNGILFNHESPRRGDDFVTRKISLSVAEIYLRLRKVPLELGNLNARRDWGHVKDYVMAMWLMMQRKEPKDYVISSGESHSVREFVEESFKCIDIDIGWSGDSQNEIGFDKKTNNILVRVSSEFFRPSEVDNLLGDSSLARKELNWKPTISFKELVREMVASDIQMLQSEKVHLT